MAAANKIPMIENKADLLIENFFKNTLITP